MRVIPQLSFSQAFNSATSRIFQFTGRSRRSEYWWMIGLVYLINLVLSSLFNVLACVVIFLLWLATIPLTFRRLHDSGRSGWWWGAGVILQMGFVFAMIYDVVAASISYYAWENDGVQFFIHFLAKYSIWAIIICIYKIVMLVFMCLDSEEGSNKYGESPKYVEDDEEETTYIND